jgi:gas vesicle protein
MSDDRAADVLLSFGIGLVAGAAAALLLSPGSGAENRRRLKEAAEDLERRVREGAVAASGRVREGTDHLVAEVKSQAGRVSHAFEEGKRAYREG